MSQGREVPARGHGGFPESQVFSAGAGIQHEMVPTAQQCPERVSPDYGIYPCLPTYAQPRVCMLLDGKGHLTARVGVLSSAAAPFPIQQHHKQICPSMEHNSWGFPSVLRPSLPAENGEWCLDLHRLPGRVCHHGYHLAIQVSF